MYTYIQTDQHCTLYTELVKRQILQKKILGHGFRRSKHNFKVLPATLRCALKKKESRMHETLNLSAFADSSNNTKKTLKKILELI